MFGDSDNMDWDYCIIVDSQTGRFVSKPYLYKNRDKARARADKLDSDYGAVRYKVVPFDYDKTVME